MNTSATVYVHVASTLPTKTSPRSRERVRIVFSPAAPCSPGHGLLLLFASLLIYSLALAGIAAFGVLLSTVTRNSAASVVGALMWALLMQLLGVLPGTERIRPYLLGTQFDAWHGFLRVPADWSPVTRALWVCALYIGLPLLGAYLVFLRRDVAGE